MFRKIALLTATAMVGAAMLSAPAAARNIRIATEGAYPPFNSKNPRASWSASTSTSPGPSARI